MRGQDNDAIDLTDNDIALLGNFPLQPRLRTLFLAQNRISNIQANLSSSIPNLTTLVLTKNRLTELADLDPLGGFKKLVYLTLMGNPVTSKEVRTTAFHGMGEVPNLVSGLEHRMKPSRREPMHCSGRI